MEGIELFNHINDEIMTIKEAEFIVNEFNDWMDGFPGECPDFSKLVTARQLLVNDLKNKAEIWKALQMLKQHHKQQLGGPFNTWPARGPVLVLHPKQVTWAMSIVIAALEKNL